MILADQDQLANFFLNHCTSTFICLITGRTLVLLEAHFHQRFLGLIYVVEKCPLDCFITPRKFTIDYNSVATTVTPNGFAEKSQAN